MPIRINLLAEQQAAEEARRKDPIKLSLMVGGALIFLMLCWVFTLYMQLKTQRKALEYAVQEFNSADDKAKVARNISANAGVIEGRIRALEKYSTNRVLWAPFLDALQQVTFENIRFKSVATGQRYTTNKAFTFFTTNINVAVTPPPASWMFWAGTPAGTPVYSIASNVFKTFTNAPPFSTNVFPGTTVFIPYTTKMEVTYTNPPGTEVRVTCDFIMPAYSTEDIDVTISGGDYSNPPGATLQQLNSAITNLTYFSSRITTGTDRAKFTDFPRPDPDLTLPGSPMHQRFTLQLKYQDRVLINE